MCERELERGRKKGLIEREREREVREGEKGLIERETDRRERERETHRYKYR